MASEGAFPTAVVLLSHNGQVRVTLMGDTATIANLDANNSISPVWKDWRSGANVNYVE